MAFSEMLKSKREELGMTQQDLADHIYVTRQTISRWENNLGYPNLDTLVDLSSLLNLSLDNLLKGEATDMVQQISKDVTDKKRYKHYLLAIGMFLGILLLWFLILGYGRATQNESIDRFNPFLRVQYGYTVLPNQVPEKKEKTTIVDRVLVQIFLADLILVYWVPRNEGLRA